MAEDGSAAYGDEDRGILPKPKEQGSTSLVGGAAANANSESKGNHLPKIKLITFDGHEPRAWIKKCTKYFEVYKIPKEQMVGIASLFLIEKAYAWYHNWKKKENSDIWEIFEKDLCARFGETGLVDVVVEFMN